jgi:hypothetical protein
MWQQLLARASRYGGLAWSHINSVWGALRVLCVAGGLVLGMAGYIYLLRILSRFDLFSHAMAVLIFGFLFYLLFKKLYSFTVEWRRIRSLPPGRFDTRPAIDGLFDSVKSDYLRNRLVVRLEEFHRKNGSRPTGSWPRGAAPNRGDRASIRLSQLDEIWTGLER